MQGFKKIINEATPILNLQSTLFDEKKLVVYVKADYLTHEEISGNKWRKLKYNLLKARALGYSKLLTFGGAFSNHIAAVAAVGNYFGFETLGIIRGDELHVNSSPTLKKASENGMNFQFVSRSDYRNKSVFIENFQHEYYCLPEGGTNELALLGVSEMVDSVLETCQPDYMFTAMGTGGTCAGMLSNKAFKNKIIGIPVLKNGIFLKQEIEYLTTNQADRLILFPEFHFGGYGKWTNELLDFMQDVKNEYQLPLDKIYTAKAFFALIDLVKKDFFAPNSTLLFYHSGGLQGG